jgi:lysophospholipase L1-like esterase
MTGGGNDIIQTPGMQAQCRQSTDACKDKLKAIGDALEKLWQKMYEKGVQDVIYIGYADAANNSGEETTDLGEQGVKEICERVPLNCHQLDTTPLVGNNGIAIDGVHPTSAANRRIATAVLKMMEERKMRR